MKFNNFIWYVFALLGILCFPYLLVPGISENFPQAQAFVIMFAMASLAVSLCVVLSFHILMKQRYTKTIGSPGLWASIEIQVAKILTKCATNLRVVTIRSPPYGIASW